MYLYTDATDGQVLALEQPCRPNFSQKFLNTITTKLGYTPTPEAIIYYIYAIFHSPTYRTRYTEFLKIDFPRVPLTSNNELFQQLANYGEELVSLHLMKSLQLDNFITKFVENDGNNLVDVGHPKYNQDAVTINRKGDKSTGVPEEVWKFQIGGYQVCQKWLKVRKGRQLIDDIKNNWAVKLQQEETLENLNVTSERINSIKKRLKKFDSLPGGLEPITVKNIIKKLSVWKELKQVHKLLCEYTEGSKANLDDETFLVQLVQDTDKLNLITNDGIKPTSLRVSLAAILT
ncbi:type ISP restriction/modification enzyme [Nostoc sp.]|uniref:type ISP restriction/modification enzyme n=1 Tax=Nostoc sp. TaxID=1180 RepID=UPI002FF9533C